MEKQNWNAEPWQEMNRPLQGYTFGLVYTLRIKDFQEMPFVDFSELAHYDPEIRTLMN